MGKRGKDDNNQGRFAAIPERALGDKRLSEVHFRVLGKVAIHDGRSSTQGGKGCFRSQRDMAAEIRVDFGNFSHALKELGIWGYLSRGRNQLNKRQWVYRVAYTARQIIEAATRAIVGPGANEIVGPTHNVLAEIVGPTTNTSLVAFEKTSNPNNDLASTLDPTRSLIGESQENEASPLPCNSRASASQKKEEEAFRKEAVIGSLNDSQILGFPEGHEADRPSKEELEQKLGRKIKWR